MSSTENGSVVPAANLPAESEKRVEAIVRNIDFGDAALNVTYGADTMLEISRFADDLLARVQAKDSGQVGETLTDLMVKVKGIDVTEIAGGKPSFMASVPVVGSLFNSARRTIAKFNTLSEQISVISDKLEEAMVGLLHDVSVLDQLYNHNEKFHNELVSYIEAGKRKIEEAGNVDLPQLRKAAEESGDPMDAQKVRDFAERINRFERRIHDLQLSRAITVQTAPQIRLIQSNNQTLAEKIQTSVLTTIPIWKSQMVLALSLQGQQSAAQLQKTVADTTNDMLRKNADMLEQAAVATAKEVERSVVDIETLRDVHGKLVRTIEETLRIAGEGREKRAAVEKELSGMENQLKEQLTAFAARKTQESAAAATGNAIPETKGNAD